MNTLTFRVKTKRRTRIKHIDVPANWAECSKKQILTAVPTLLQRPNSIEAKVELLYAILKRHKKLLFGLNDEQVLDLLPLVDWMYEAPIDTPYIPSFRHRRETYHLPCAKLSNSSCLEWYMADDYYTKFLKSQSQEDLNRLIATLCRPADTNQQAAIRRDDVRVQLISKMEVERRAEQLSMLDEDYKIYVLAYFSGCKKWVYSTYAEYLFPNTSDESTSEEGSTNPLGWYGLFQQVAESGVFGSLQNLLINVKFKDFCVYLIGKKIEYDNWKRKQPKPN